MMDKKNINLLYELSKDSRAPVTQIAKKLRISKQSANYRINGLIKKGIITQFYSLVNFTALGYKPYKIFLGMNNLSADAMNDCLNKLAKRSNIVWTVLCGGKFDIIIGLIAKNTQDFREIYLNILKEFNDIIQFSDHSTIISAHQKSRSFFLKRDKSGLNEFYIGGEKTPIDQKDKTILKELSLNSRTPILNIADKISLTAEATRIRISNLRKKNILMGSSILINSEKLGYLSYKLLFNLKNKSRSINSLKRVSDYLITCPEVNEVINVLGNWDIETDLDLKSIYELEDFISTVRNRFPELISGYHILTKYRENNYNYFPIE